MYTCTVRKKIPSLTFTLDLPSPSSTLLVHTNTFAVCPKERGSSPGLGMEFSALGQLLSERCNHHWPYGAIYADLGDD